ncbi:calcium-binding protein [Kribbella sp. NBC_01245]|uniref:calcium-binding protein n=1 Tax=Kribbella sp. NBC_01245 TaxID=2903578 RepID=UPI002E2A4C07|nr:calcium-binding protein [Kribbella sp. NBC_01245]
MGVFRLASSRLVSVTAAVSLLTGMLVVTAQPARAAENGVDDLLGMLGAGGVPNSLATWTSGLATIDKLGEPLPLVGASPGGLLGLNDVFLKGVTDELDDAVDFGDLSVDKDITIDGGRTGHLKTTVSDLGAGKKLDIVATVDRTVTGQDLRLSNASPKVELSVSDGVTLGLKSRLALSVVWTGSAEDKVYLVHSTTTPRLDVDAHASIDNAAAKAAIGILGVSLTGSSLDVDAHLVGTVSDPDNDGKLSFSDNGELAQAGSLDGLFTAGLDPLGSQPIDESDPASRGSVHATFQLGAAASGIPASLPSAISATVQVDWNDIGVGAPVVSAPDLAATVGKFQNMSLRDLAEGIAQVVTSLTAIQNAKYDPDAGGPLPTIGDLDLPFMKGTLADVIRVNEVLKNFLAANTIPAPGQPGFVPGVTDPAQAGQPTFTSLQDLLKKLDDASDIDLSGLVWDAGSSKLAFNLAMTKTAPVTPVDLDPVSIEASGPTASYGAKTLTVAGAGWSPNQWLGRRVVAGTSAGEVASNDASTITLKADWAGGQPALNSPYVIAGSEPHIGAVTFANKIDQGGQGILNANAEQTFAKVTPSFTAALTLVLDLQDARTGDACIGFLGSTQACPFTQSNGALDTVIPSLPLNTDRMMIRTGSSLFSADFPIDTAVDLTANAGYFKVQLKGTLKVCNSSLSDTCAAGTATGHMMSLSLKQQGDAQHDLRLSELFKQLVDSPTSLIDVDVNVRAYGDVTVSVPDATQFLPAGASTKFTAKWGDLTDPSTIALDTGDLSEVFKLDFDANDPKALFTALIKTLQTLSKQLAEANTADGDGVFDKDIPGLGKSLRDMLVSDESNAGPGVSYGADTVVDTNRSGGNLFGPDLVGRSIVVGTQVGIVKTVAGDGKSLTLTKPWESAPPTGTPYMMRSALDDVTDRLLANTPDNIQDAVELLNSALGNQSVKFRYLEVDGKPNLVLDVDWQRDYRAAAPIKLSLGNLNGSDQTFAAAQATGLAQVEVTGRIKVGLVVPLAPGEGPANGAALLVLEDSSISVAAKATLTNGSVQGVVGPLSIALGNPTAGAPAAEKAQAKADLSIALAKSGAAANTPVSFTDFIGAVGVNFNATNGTVSCGETLDTPLMVCGSLPIFLNNTGADDGWVPIGTIALRVPDSTTPADLLDLNDNLPAPDDAKKELELPADLGTRLANALLDFGNFGDGLEGYLAAIEQAFRTASFQGKLPLIGEDLQQGADFIGDLRTKLRSSIWNDLPGGGRPANSKEFKDFINAKLADALAEVDIAATEILIGFDCTATLAPAGAPTVTEDPVDVGTTTWEYQIVAYQGDGTQPDDDTVPSAAGQTTKGAATLNDTNFNHITWASVPNATGYKVLRKGPGDTGFKLIKDAGNALAHDDKGDTGADYTAATQQPDLHICGLNDIAGVSLEFTATRGKVSAAKGCENTGATKPCFHTDLPLDIGIPGLALRQGKDGTDGISVDAGFALHFKLGLNKTDGFFVNTHDGWGPDNKALAELQVGLAFDLPDTMVAELAFIKINVDKATGGTHDPTKPLFAGAFQIDLKAAGETSCFKGDETACTPDENAKIKFADLGSGGDMFGVSLTGAFHLDWIVEAQVDSAFPGVRANFQLMWSFDNQAPDGPTVPYIAFKDVGISAGSFFEGLLGDVVKEMKRVTGPLQPVIDTLYAPIPVLSDLSRLAGGDDVTLMTLAKAFSTLAGGPKLDFVDTIKAVIEFINRLPSCSPDVDNDCYVPLGDFEIAGDKALNTSNSPTTADKMYKGTPNAKSANEVKSGLNDKNEHASADANPIFGGTGLAPDEGDAEKSGITFPILENPASAFNLLMGGDITLVEFDSGPLTLGFSWRQAFGPVYAPPPVFVTLAGSASVSLRIVAGLDTYGIRKAVEAAQNGTPVDAIDVLDGLFFKTVDNAGTPIPVVQLTGEIAAGAAVSVVILTVGIEGGLRLTIGFYWNDPNDDGKFRVSEFLHAALNNPLCLFTVSGRLSLFLRVYITIGVSIFSVSFSFTLADVTLLDFSVAPDCEPPPPKLGGTVGDTLVVYAGKYGKNAQRGSPWGNEAAAVEKDTVKVISLHYAQKPGDEAGTNAAFDGFAVEMLGERREYLDPNLKRVVVDGSGYDKPMNITFIGDGKKETGASAGNSPAIFDKDAVAIGGNAADVITTGRGLSFVDGRGGDDIIVTGDTGGATSKAMVAGGAGKDTITTGNGDDKVAGDASLGSATKARTVTHNAQDNGGTNDLSAVFDWENIADPTTQAQGAGTGDDTIGLGLGANKARGNAGGDTISVATDRPDGTLPAGINTIVGDAGNDRLTGGSNADRIFTAAETEFEVDDPGPADTGATNVVDTGLGSDKVWGSTGIDLVTSHSQGNQSARILGGSENDILLGGFGTDEVYGGPGQDYVIAEPAEVGANTGDDIIGGVNFGPRRTVNKLPLPAGVPSNPKTLVGGLGDDHIVGGDGPAKVFGDKRIDDELCKPGAPVTSDPVAESTSEGTGDGNDRILGGAGIDTVSAGGANDLAELFGANDLACGQQGQDTLRGGGDKDHLWGGSEADILYGDAGVDHVFGNNGNDVAYGGTETDVVEGNNGSDWATGGTGADLIYGGTRAAGRADTGDDDLYGDSGNDRIIGDNGTVDDPENAADAAAIPFDLDGETATAGSGDRIHGGDNEDTAYGGLGGDTVNGNNGNDHLEGNNATDVVHGNDGEDSIAGGSFQQAVAGTGRPDTGDFLFGDGGPDLITGDNAILALTSDPAATTPVTRQRGFALGHTVTLLDLGLTPAAGTSGNDQMSGGDDQDVLYGQDGADRAKGDDHDDYVEGGQGSDWVEGDLADDDLVGGSSVPLAGAGANRTGQPDTADAVFGGPGDDVVAGDNGQVLRPAVGQTPTRATVRLGTEPGELMAGRIVDRYDLAALPSAAQFGADRLSGGEGVDTIWGQDGGDFISGGAHADYAEGNGGADVLRGDLSLAGESDLTTVVPLADPGWPGSASAAALLEGALTPDGQDDLIGGSSAKGFRDTGDTIEADGAADVVLGDNGTLMRTVTGPAGARVEMVYADRYPNGTPPAGATVSRTHDPDFSEPSTRFCTEAQATCEAVGAFGNDNLYGEAGDDGIWGQDGDDLILGGADNDDLYGELGDDKLFGENGEDAILGDRGGVVNQYLDTGDSPAQFTFNLTSPPAETYVGFRREAYDRRVDLEHDVDGDQWIGSSTSAEMPHDGITTGGRDQIRGGADADNIHSGFGDDLANGDSGGDQVFGADGEDVLWGGKGCDPVLNAATPDCLTNGVFNPDSRGTNDRFIDHTFGGVGEPDLAKQDIVGSDVLDFNPRGAYPANCAPGDWPVTTNGVTVDPCLWFELTSKSDDTAEPETLANNSHHQGTDWIYGGWDRDVLQADVAQNGPNPGDRLIDWNGTYNLYTHCNPAYGGYNDIRQHSPAMTDYLNLLAWGSGAGRATTDVTTKGTSAYRELAYAYNPDFNAHAVGPAYPTTPGHFDDPVSCSD